MQSAAALRRACAAPSASHGAACRWMSGGGSRGSRGWGWYRQYKNEGPESFARAPPREPFDWSKSATNGQRRDKVFLELEIGSGEGGRIEIELANDLLPTTCKNFKQLCEGSGGSGFHYKGTIVHMLARGVGLMAGDVEGKAGAGSHSSLGSRFFPDEAFLIPHSEPGLLTMANSGRDTNGSQFYMTVEATPFLDGRCVAFGRITSGLSLAQKAFQVYHARGRPVTPIKIVDSGLVDQ